jgi:hypothetical protein
MDWFSSSSKDRKSGVSGGVNNLIIGKFNGGQVITLHQDISTYIEVQA